MMKAFEINEYSSDNEKLKIIKKGLNRYETEIL
jgi:hypothetical protein